MKPTQSATRLAASLILLLPTPPAATQALADPVAQYTPTPTADMPGEPQPSNPSSSYSLFLSPDFSFYKLTATDSKQNQATFASGASPGISGDLVARWSSAWEGRLDAGVSFVSMSTSSGRDTLGSADQTLWHVRAELRYHPSENLSLSFEPGLASQLFADRTSFTSLGIESMSIPEAVGGVHLSAYRSPSWEAGPELGLGILFPASSADGLEANTGFLIRGALTAEHGSGEHPMAFSVYFEDRDQSTSVSSSSAMQLGLRFSFGINLFGEGQKTPSSGSTP